MAKTETAVKEKLVNDAYTIQLLEKLLGNPFIWIVGGTLIIEQLEYRGYVGNLVATSAEAALFMAAIAKSLGPEGIAAAGAAVSDVIGAVGGGLSAPLRLLA
jgi:hypothetical protein